MKSLVLFAEKEGQPAPAPEGGKTEQPAGPLSGPMAPIFILGLVMLFIVMVVFPSQRRSARAQEQMLATLKRGAKVLTNGGIVGTIVSAKDGEDEIIIRSEDTRLRIKRNVVVQILGSDEAEAAKQ
jgi:preprotein translocase subunit YajC